MKFLSHFRFSKSQRSGIFFLILIVVGIQFLTVGWGVFKIERSISAKKVSIVTENNVEQKFQHYKFNPNYLTDFKGYSLGLSTEEINALFEYREAGDFVNSSLEFQKVTGVSDSLLKTIDPYVKFPEFKTLPQKTIIKKHFEKADVNLANPKDFENVYGIGEKLGLRIVKYRDLLGGFYFKDQLNEVYGLDEATVKQVWKLFDIKKLPNFKKLDVNQATVKELNNLPYIDWELAKKIVSYRSAHLKINSIDELTKIEDFPSDKLNRIELYLAAESTLSRQIQQNK